MSLYLFLNLKEKLGKRYQIISNLEIKEKKNIFRSINYYSPRLAVVLESNKSDGKIIVKDCQRKIDHFIDRNKLVR